MRHAARAVCPPVPLVLQEEDTDGNGVVDTKEFLDWIVERKQATDLVVRQLNEAMIANTRVSLPVPTRRQRRQVTRSWGLASSSGSSFSKIPCSPVAEAWVPGRK
jgi:hypothetical protein